MPPPVQPPAWKNLLTAATDEWRATPFYRLMLRGLDPDRIVQWGTDWRVGDAVRGREIAAGQWRIASERLAGVWPLPWGAPPPSPHFSARLHSFAWLIDLAAVGPEADRRIAELVQSWAIGFGEWHAQAWAPELVAERLFAWLCHGKPAFEGVGAENRLALMRALGRQARHLALAAQDIRRPSARFKAGAALVLAACAGAAEGDRLQELGVEMLEEAVAQQFLPDGGHASRAPEAGFEALADLAAADDALARRGHATPKLMRDLMPKLANMVRYHLLGDGALAAFHGGGSGAAATIARVLENIAGEARAFRIAPHSAYHRLEAGEVVLVLDGGASPPPALGERAHAGALAFEMSCGVDRLIVNVGSSRELSPDWRAAGRATNGHSTLIVDDALSTAFEAPRLGRAGAYPVGPPGVSAKRNDDDDGARVECQHEGYRQDYGLVHRRTIFLSASGTDLRGLDVLARPLAEGKSTDGLRIPFAVRFHLHPDVVVERLESRTLRLETKGGAHWRLRTDAEAVSIEPSVFLSAGGAPLATRQIVLVGEADPDGVGDKPPNRVRWALSRIDAFTG
jgi:uncharacterized heparinase superfamily protein